MAKDINIHIKTKGAERTKQDLGKVAGGARKVGGETEQMGEKVQKGSGRLVTMLGKLVGPLGFAAVAVAIAGAARKVARFFDEIKKRSDEAVRQVQQLRAGYDDLFEAMGAFDEKSRETVAKQSNLLLQKMSATKELGLPIIDAYTRQFAALVDAGQLSQEQYERGLEGMLSYGARHGGAATADLVAMMSGWGMVTPEQQGQFRRQIAEGAGAVGLKDKDVIAALGRAVPTIKAMGWTPEYAVEAIATIAGGEVGRKRMSLPGTTLQTIMAPQEGKLPEWGIEEELAERPRELLERVGTKRAEMEPQRFTRMLTDIYGVEAAAGVHKLLVQRRQDLADTLARAAGEEGAAAEQAEEQAYMTTLEAREARTRAVVRGIKHDLTEAEKYMEDIRQIGQARRDVLGRREPVPMKLAEWFKTDTGMQEYAAFRQWKAGLTAKEKVELEQKPSFDVGRWGAMPESPYLSKWESMTARQKWEVLVSQGLPSKPGPIESEQRVERTPERTEQEAPAPVSPQVPASKYIEPEGTTATTPAEKPKVDPVLTSWRRRIERINKDYARDLAESRDRLLPAGESRKESAREDLRPYLTALEEIESDLTELPASPDMWHKVQAEIVARQIGVLTRSIAHRPGIAAEDVEKEVFGLHYLLEQLQRDISHAKSAEPNERPEPLPEPPPQAEQGTKKAIPAQPPEQLEREEQAEPVPEPQSQPQPQTEKMTPKQPPEQLERQEQAEPVPTPQPQPEQRMEKVIPLELPQSVEQESAEQPIVAPARQPRQPLPAVAQYEQPAGPAAPATSVNYDHRQYQIQIYNPIAGMNPVDLGIEQPNL